MVYKTLHSYIIRELLRIFLLTAVALTTLMAFGGLFKPITKYGLDVGQLLVIILNMMPAMLAYAIPVAALFAAVLVYWRMSTDNELTACRAGGISFVALVMPAFILGLVVASVDLFFVNYVVPRFLQSTERAVMRDLGSLIVSAIGRQEKFQYQNLVVYADRAELLPSQKEGQSVVVLNGMAASLMEEGRPSRTVVAREARLVLTNSKFEDAVQLEVSLDGAAAFDPSQMFRKYMGPVPSIMPDGRPYSIPSQLRTKPKFLNWRQLSRLNRDPTSFPSVAEVLNKVGDAYTLHQIAQRLMADAAPKNPTGKARYALTFDQSGAGTGTGSQLRVSAPSIAFNPAASPESSLGFYGTADGPVRIEQWTPRGLQQSYTCDTALVELTIDKFAGTGVGARLVPIGNIKRRDEILKTESQPPDAVLSGIVLPASLQNVALPEPPERGKFLQTYAAASPSPVLRKLDTDLRDRMRRLFQNIDSERHSRGSFSLSCLTLVLLGAALGILLRGKNPLAVFVVGFVPAVILVLLITAGRELAESSRGSVNAGIALIWAGNGILLALVAGVYAKLLRQ